MKKILLSLLVVAGFTVMAQTGTDGLIKFDTDAHAFGKVKQNTPVTYEFKFTNPSKKPLIIEKAEAECGCTTPVFPTKPIMPGKTGTIKVTYDAKNAGAFTKKVTVRLVNVTDTKILTINGEVIP